MKTIAQARFDSGAIVRLARLDDPSSPYGTFTENARTGERADADRFDDIRDAVLGFARRCAEELTRRVRHSHRT